MTIDPIAIELRELAKKADWIGDRVRAYADSVEKRLVRSVSGSNGTRGGDIDESSVQPVEEVSGTGDWAQGDLVKYDAHGCVFTARLIKPNGGACWLSVVESFEGVHDPEGVFEVGESVSVVYGHSVKIASAGSVADSELRDRVAKSLHALQCFDPDVSGFDCPNPEVHWTEWATLAEAALHPVAPVLAAAIQQRDEALADAAQITSTKNAIAGELRIEESNAEFSDRALHLVLGCCDPAIEDDECSGRAGKVYEALRRGGKVPYSWQGQSDAIAMARSYITELAKERDRERATRETSQLIVNEAGEALRKIADQSPWEQPPSLMDRIGHVAFRLKKALAERDELRVHGVARDIGEANEQLRAERDAMRHLLGCIWLYVNWRQVTKQLETVQKDMWADAVDSFGDPDERRPGKAERWWRDDESERVVERITYVDHEGVTKVWDWDKAEWAVEVVSGSASTAEEER